jgi:aminopeptidase N
MRRPQVAASGIQLDAKEERATFLFSQVLMAGTEGVLNVEFTGIHNDKMSGFYRSQYTDGATKEKKTLVVTQFEPTGALCRFF